MGIRFRCHHCESELHVKDFQAGKRGRCPECGGPFRIPLEDAPHSLDPQVKLPESQASVSQAKSGPVVQKKATHARAEKGAKAVDAAGAAPQTVADAAATGPKVPAAKGDSTKAASESMTAASESTKAASGSPKAASGSTKAVSGSVIAADRSAKAASRSAITADSPIADSAALDLPAAPPTSLPPQPALPRALQVASDGKWYVRPPSGGQYGPAASGTMWQWLVENRVGRDALVWTEGWPEWIIAETAFDDYFTAAPALPADIPPAPLPVAGRLNEQAIAPGQTAVAPVAPAEPLLGDRNRAERKQKRRRNYTLMIVGLSVVMLVLIATLIFVLGSQAS